MNDMERRKFEDSFQDAFNNAEASPSENVWTNIELELEKADRDKMKRRLVFFKMLAAASVVFAMSIAGIGYYIFQHSDTGNLAQRTSSPSVSDLTKPRENGDLALPQNSDIQSPDRAVDHAPAIEEQANQASSSVADNAQPGVTSAQAVDGSLTPPSKANDATRSDANASVAGKVAKGSAPSIIGTDKNLTSTTPDVTPTAPLGIANIGSDDRGVIPSKSVSPYLLTAGEITRQLPPLSTTADPQLELPSSTADPGMLLLAKLADEEKKYALEEKSRAKKNKEEKLWTSVGFAAGAFGANNPTVDAVPSNMLYSMNSSNTASIQSKASGLSYSVGVNVGTKLSERWVLQGGVNYLTQTYDYTANSVVVIDNNFEAVKAASINAFAPQSADAMANTKVAQTFPYNVNNNLRFVSLPVQAGYLVVDRKFGLQVNAGVSTDVFLQNTISPEVGGVSATTQGAGDESPYRSLNFSGLMGTEFSYKLGYRYRVSLNPALRYPFSSVYKSSTGVNSTPLTFDVGLRFRYIFH